MGFNHENEAASPYAGHALGAGAVQSDASLYAAKRNVHLAQGQVNYAGLAAVPEQPMFAELSQKLSLLYDIVNEAGGSLTHLRDRLFGPSPASPESSGAKNGRSGQATELIAAVDILIARAAGVREEAHLLNSHI